MSVDKATLDELRIHRTSGGTRNRKPAAIVAILVIMGAVALALFIARPKRKVVRVAAAQGIGGEARGAVLNASGYVTARRQATVSSSALAA